MNVTLGVSRLSSILGDLQESDLQEYSFNLKISLNEVIEMTLSYSSNKFYSSNLQYSSLLYLYFSFFYFLISVWTS